MKQKKIIFWLLLILIFPFLIYLNSLQSDFLYGDAQNIVLHNSYLKDWKYLPKFFREAYISGAGVESNYWRPAQLVISSVIVHALGYKPWVFHLSSILFHALCGLLIFLIFLKLFQGKVSTSLIAVSVLAWLAHPIHNEEITITTGITSPGHLFGVLLGLYAFLLFAEKEKWYWYGLSLLGFITGLLFKESAVIFPAPVLFMHVVSVKTGLLKPIKLLGYIRRHLTFWLLALFYVYARLSFLNFGGTLNFYKNANIFTQNLAYRINTFFTIIAHGLKIIFIPLGLHPERTWPIFTDPLSTAVILSFLAVLVLVILAIVSFLRNPLFSFGILWFFVAYLPFSNIAATINALVWDHWFYTPSVGILLSIVSLPLFIERPVFQRLLLIILIPAIIVFSFISFRLNPFSRTNESYARFVLSYEPETARVWNTLAMSLADKGEDDKAIKAYITGIKLSGNYPQMFHNLGQLYLKQAQYALAERAFLGAIYVDPYFYHSYLALGRLYLARNYTKTALYYFKRAYEIYPYLPDEIVEFIKRETGLKK